MKNQFEYYKDLLIVLTSKSIKTRYKNNILGYLWSIINPLGFTLVYYIVFSTIMRFKMENYLLFLITGLFPWQWFANSASASTRVFIQNASLIKKINFEKSVLALSLVLQDVFHFVFALPVIGFFILLYGEKIHLSWLYGIPILIVIQSVLTFGLALFLGSLNIFLRDIENIISILLQFLFFGTPILYPLKKIPQKYHWLISLNPCAILFKLWREVLLEGKLSLHYLLYSVIYSLLALFIGYYTYKNLSKKFAEVI